MLRDRNIIVIRTEFCNILLQPLKTHSVSPQDACGVLTFLLVVKFPRTNTRMLSFEAMQFPLFDEFLLFGI